MSGFKFQFGERVRFCGIVSPETGETLTVKLDCGHRFVDIMGFCGRVVNVVPVAFDKDMRPVQGPHYLVEWDAAIPDLVVNPYVRESALEVCQ